MTEGGCYLGFPTAPRSTLLYPTLFSGPSMTKTGKRIALVPAVLAGIVVLYFTLLATCTPRLSHYKDIRLPSRSATADTQGLRVTFLGVSTLLIQDDTSQIMTDGFFTRPRLWQLPFRLTPNRRVIRKSLGDAGADSRKMRGVIALHSHYDHAMDAPTAARMMRTKLVGGRSTALINAASDSVASMDTVKFGDRRQYGGFAVTFIPCRHGKPDRFFGVIDTLELPASKERYLTGECFTLHIQHGGQSMLVTGTAGFSPDSLKNVRADVVYLSVGGLGEQDSAYRAHYWREVVQATGARRVVLIHWDFFFRSLSRPLVPVPRTPLKEYSDRFHTTFGDLCKFAERDRVDLRVAREWVAADPFEDLPPNTTQRTIPSCPDL